jgi:hypothetical protein
VAFDATRDECANERYVRFATGFDALGAAPLRSARAGIGGETLALKIVATPAATAGQSQRQG